MPLPSSVTNTDQTQTMQCKQMGHPVSCCSCFRVIAGKCNDIKSSETRKYLIVGLVVNLLIPKQPHRLCVCVCVSHCHVKPVLLGEEGGAAFVMGMS